MSIPWVVVEEQDPFVHAKTNYRSAKYDHSDGKQVDKAIIRAIIAFLLVTTLITSMSISRF